MAFKLTWKPVLQALMLKDYHADYVDEKIMVCVNPQPAFMRERRQLMAEYATRFSEVELLTQKAQQASGKKKNDAQIVSGKKNAEFLTWAEKTFLPGVDAWFAALWSFGDEPYTVEDLKQYHDVDPHFLSWLKARSIEMIEAHASARKKA